MTYADAIAFWFGRINFEVKAARPQDFRLERMAALLHRLGDPHASIPIVHVTGTKGKGSVCAMVDAVLRAAGYSTGLFVSPHLTHVEERIRVNGEPIPQEAVTAVMAEVAPAVLAVEAETGIGLSFFEVATALGFLHFARQKVEVAVVEVGLGGRFDSTNVVTPLVSVITSIGLDHTQQLGLTEEEIAFQKAGIIKCEVPLVSGVTTPAPRDVIEKVAKEIGSPVDRLGREFRYAATPGIVVPPPGVGLQIADPSGGDPLARLPAIRIHTDRRVWPEMELKLLGPHQAANAAIAVATIERLQVAGFAIPDEAVVRGLKTVDWPARVEVLGTRPTIILDCAHNHPSVDSLLATLDESIPNMGARRLVFAVSNDKPWIDMLRALARYFQAYYLTTYGANPRCVPADELAEVVKKILPNADVRTFDSAAAAWAAARSDSGPDDLVCITGSVFLAGELRPVMVG
ncbi:MAG TPA: folylpolyglutamate synthase/dihydrofolate synthase family protein [Fimbriiglobus sp.]|jgi:dihydrofolate synthase/folylpolyglutamate synthase